MASKNYKVKERERWQRYGRNKKKLEVKIGKNWRNIYLMCLAGRVTSCPSLAGVFLALALKGSPPGDPSFPGKLGWLFITIVKAKDLARFIALSSKVHRCLVCVIHSDLLNEERNVSCCHFLLLLLYQVALCSEGVQRVRPPRLFEMGEGQVIVFRTAQSLGLPCAVDWRNIS